MKVVIDTLFFLKWKWHMYVVCMAALCAVVRSCGHVYLSLAGEFEYRAMKLGMEIDQLHYSARDTWQCKTAGGHFDRLVDYHAQEQ